MAPRRAARLRQGRPWVRSCSRGKLNLYRFFIVRSLALSRMGGRYGMIVPLPAG